MSGTWRIPFTIGEAAPWFQCASPINPKFQFGTVAGRYVVLSLLGDPRSEPASGILNFIHANRTRFADDPAFFAVITQPTGVEPPQGYTAPRFFHDFDGKVSALYQALDAQGTYHPYTLVLDPLLRVRAMIPIADAATHNQQLSRIIDSLDRAKETSHAPVLVIPRILEPELCRELIGLYQTHGGEPSGYMREVDGKTVPVLNPNFKRRKDFYFDGPDFKPLRDGIDQRLTRRLLPQVFKAFQFRITRIERYVVACYSDDEQGFFSAHRDNTTPGTAHRRFACTINLNAEDYDGGELRFPEFGNATYRAPTGGAVVFSCSLLHEATPVTRGTRYAFLPFFYNEETLAQRQSGMKTLGAEPIIEMPK